jgi:hypothetical protein
MYEGRINKGLEEFLYKAGLEIPFRDIQAGKTVLHLCTPANHNVLPNVPMLRGEPPAGELAILSKLYFGLAEEIGRDLEQSDFSYEEAYLSGICFFSSWHYMDPKATGLIITLLHGLAPPVFKFIFLLPYNETDAGEWLPTAIAMQGSLAGQSDAHFKRLAWAHQSWMLYRDSRPYPGIEDLEAYSFFDHCYSASKPFYCEYPHYLSVVSEPSIDLDEFPSWTGTAVEKDALFELVRSRWGYDPSDESLATVERKQMRACIIFSLFCAMCKAARRQ